MSVLNQHFLLENVKRKTLKYLFLYSDMQDYFYYSDRDQDF